MIGGFGPRAGEWRGRLAEEGRIGGIGFRTSLLLSNRAQGTRTGDPGGGRQGDGVDGRIFEAGTPPGVLATKFIFLATILH